MDDKLGSLANVDLNLLVPLHALLQQRSVTMAAAVLGLSQPACSSALKRLRQHYDDPLLERRGGSLHQLTPFAERLLARLEPAMKGISAVVGRADAADPGTMNREFVLLMADSDALVIAGDLLDLAAREAPGVSFRFEQPTLDGEADVTASLHAVDVRVLPGSLVGSLPSIVLHEDEWVCLVGAHSAVFELRDFAGASWVTAFHRPPWTNSPLQALEGAGVRPHVVATTESFLSLRPLVVGSDRVALLPRSAAEHLRGLGGVEVIPAPFAATRFDICIVWHPLHEHDPAHLWLRSALQRVSRHVTPKSTERSPLTR